MLPRSRRSEPSPSTCRLDCRTPTGDGFTLLWDIDDQDHAIVVEDRQPVGGGLGGGSVAMAKIADSMAPRDRSWDHGRDVRPSRNVDEGFPVKYRCVAASLVFLALAGCGGSSEHLDAAGRAESLWSSRAPYVGDNSRVTALVEEVGLAHAGSYSIKLQTAKPPYGLTIDLKRPDKPFDATDFSGQATLLLGLVTNLDKVSITSGEDGYSLHAAAASQDLGYDVKQLGREQRTLVRYLERTSD